MRVLNAVRLGAPRLAPRRGDFWCAAACGHFCKIATQLMAHSQRKIMEDHPAVNPDSSFYNPFWPVFYLLVFGTVFVVFVVGYTSSADKKRLQREKRTA
jgi:hypothetical protein